MNADLLRRIDLDRRTDGKTSAQGDIVREFSPDGLACRILYSRCAADQVHEIIRAEVSLAEARKYSLEWKVYGHDLPPGLKDGLLQAGFEARPVEALMVLPVTDDALVAFNDRGYSINRIYDKDGLRDVAAISREIGRSSVAEETNRLALTLQSRPDQMSVYVAYIQGEPVACGRIDFKEHSEFATLCGGRTKSTYRNQGLYTALVGARLREALARNCKYAMVDALPTSEPILTRRGFKSVTDTQPFLYRPNS